MMRSKKWTLAILSALVLICAALSLVFLPKATASADTYPCITVEIDTSKLSEAGADSDYAGLYVNAEGYPVFFTDMQRDDVKQYLVVTYYESEEDTEGTVLNTSQYEVTGSITGEGTNNVTITYASPSGATYSEVIGIDFTNREVISIDVNAGTQTNNIPSRFSGSVSTNLRPNNISAYFDDFVVTAYYNDGTSAPTVDYSIDGDLYMSTNAGTTTQKNLTITYTGTDAASGNIYKTVEATIEASGINAEMVSWGGSIANTQYAYTEVDPGDVEVTILYQGGGLATKTIQLASAPAGRYSVKYYKSNGESHDGPLEIDDDYVVFTYHESGQDIESGIYNLPENITPQDYAQPGFNNTAATYDPVNHPKITMTGYNSEIMELIAWSAVDTADTDTHYDTGLTVEYNGSNVIFTATAAGTYTITVTIKDEGIGEGYQWAASGDGTRDPENYKKVTYTWTVNKAVATPGLSIDDWTYGETPSEAQITLAGNEGDQYIHHYSGTPNDPSQSAITDQTTAPTEAGSYELYVTIGSSRNYAYGISNTVEFTINRKAVEAPTVENKTYNGATQTSGLTGDSIYTVTSDVGGVNVSSYTTTLTLANAYNYKWQNESEGEAETTVTWNIIPKELAMPVLGTPSSSSFTGSDITVAISKYSSFCDEYGDGCGISVSVAAATTVTTQPSYANGTITAVNAATYNVTITLANSTNYKWAEGVTQSGGTVTLQFTINRQQLAIPTWGNNSNSVSTTFNNSDQTQTITFASGFNTSLVTLSESGGSLSGFELTAKDVDTYTVTISLTAAAMADYEWSDSTQNSVTLTWNITADENTLSFSISGWTYSDGTVAQPSDITVKYGDASDVTFTYYYKAFDGTGSDSFVSVGSTPTFNAGYYYVVGSIAETDNYGAASYGGENVTNFTVARASVEKPTVATPDSYVYNYGADISVQLSGAGLGTSYSITEVDGSSNTAGTATTAGAHTITVTLNGNYKWSGESEPAGTNRTCTLNWTIAQLSVTRPTADGTSFTYTGSAQTYTFGSYDGKAINISPSSAYTEFSYDSEAGTLTALHAGDYTVTLSLKDDNFKWATSGDDPTYTWNIAQDENSFTLTMSGWEYITGGTQGNSPQISDLKFGKAQDIQYTYYYKDNLDNSWTQLSADGEGNVIFNAGQYYVTATLAGTGDYKDVTVTAGSEDSPLFTVSKQAVNAPTLTGGYENEGRYLEYDNGQTLRPTVTQNDSLYTVKNDTESSNYGDYTLTVTLKDFNNYCWNEGSLNAGAQENETLTDSISGAVLTMWYRITKTQYQLNVSITGWQYGSYSEVANKPTVSANVTGVKEVTDALAGATFTYYEADDTQQQNGSSNRPTEAGSYVVVANVAETNNYAAQTASTTFEITAANLTVSATGYSDTYNAADHDALVSITVTAKTDNGSANGTENLTSSSYTIEYRLNGSSDWSTTMPQVRDVADSGTVYFRITGVDNHNDYTNGSFTVTISKYSTSITWSGAEDNKFTYDGADHLNDVTATLDVLEGDQVGGADIALDVSVSSGSADNSFKNAGNYTLTADTSAYTGNYEIDHTTQTYTIERRAVTVRAADSTSVYGEEPDLTEIYSGDSANNTDLQFVEDDDITVSVESNATNASGVGTYRIYISGVSSTESGALSNYTINGVAGESFAGYAGDVSSTYDGTLTITARPISVNIPTPDGKEYTGGYQTATAEAGAVSGNPASGVANGDEIEFNYSYALTSGGESTTQGALNAGTYTVTVSLPDNSNYKLEGTNTATFTIKPYTVTSLTWSDTSFTYNGEDQSESAKALASFQGIGQDSSTTYTLVTSTSGEFKDAGPYTFTAAFDDEGATTSEDGNYTLAENATTKQYTMAKRAVYITLGSDSKQYGDALPTFSWSYSGSSASNDNNKFVDGISENGAIYDISAAVSTEVLNGTTYIVSPQGSYDITATIASGYTATLANYDVQITDGKLTVSPRAITVQIEATSSTYGDNEATIGYSYADGTSLYAGDTAAEVFTITAGVTSTSAVGDYAVTLTNEKGDTYYNITLANSGASGLTVDDLYTVTPATITGVSVTPTTGLGYNGADQFSGAFTEGATTVNGMEQTWTFSLSQSGDFTSTLTLKDAGTYNIYYKITADNHYEYSSGSDYFTVVIDKADLTVTVTGTTTYGEEAPEYSEYKIEAVGLQGSDSVADLLIAGTTFNISHSYTQGSDAGTYYLTVTQAQELTNYNVAYVSGQGSASTLTVNQREITLRINDVSVDFGTPGTLSLTLTEGSFYNSHSTSDFLGYIAVYSDTEGNTSVTADGTLERGTYYIIGKDTNTGIAANYDITFVGETSGNVYGIYSVAVVTINVEGSFNGSLIYDGNQKVYTVHSVTPGVTVEFSYKYEQNTGTAESPVWITLSGAPTNAGNYRVTYTSQNPNYTVSGATYNFTIEKATFNVTVSFNDSYTNEYDGKPYAPTVNGLQDQAKGIDGTELVVSYDNGITDVTSGTTFKAYLSLSNDTNYKLETTQLTTTVIITAKVVDITWVTDDFTYDGTDQSGKVTAYYLDVNGNKVDLAVTLTDGSFVNANTYTFSAAFATEDTGSSNYALPSTVTKDFTIKPAEVDVTISHMQQVYTGEQFSTVTGVKGTNYTVSSGTVYNGDDLGITITITDGATNVGKYDVTAKAANTNYKVTFVESSLSQAYEITKATIADGDVSFTIYGGTSGATYDATTHQVASDLSVTTSTVVGHGNTPVWSFSLDGSNYYPIDNANVLVRNVTAYTVYYKITADNHNTYTGQFTVTINPYEVSVEWVDDNFTYNGEDQKDAVTATYTDLGKNVRNLVVTLSDDTEFRDVDGGKNYTFTAAFDTNSDPVYQNYSLNVESTTETFNMKKATLEWATEFAWVDAGNTEYAWIYLDEDFMDNRTAPVAALANNAAYTIAEDENGVVVTYYTDASCTQPVGPFSSTTNAGTYYAKVTVAETGNYYGIEATYSFEVEQKAVSIDWNTQEPFIFDGAQKTNTLNYEEYMSVDNATGTGQISYTNDVGQRLVTMTATAQGVYSVEVTLTSNNYKWNTNELAKTITVSWSISNAANSWTTTLTIKGWIYGQYSDDNLPNAEAAYGVVEYRYTAAGASAPDSADDFYGLSATVPTNAGTYYVMAYVEGTENYGRLWAVAQFTISRAEITKPTEDTDSFTYSGNSQTYMPEGFDADTMFISGNVQTNASSYTVTVSLRDKLNYKWADTEGNAETADLTFTFVINKQQVTAPTMPAGTWTYDGERQELVLDGFNSATMGIQSMGSLVVEVTESTNVKFVTRNAGEYTIKISLKNSDNFQWAAGTSVDSDGYATYTWVIGKAANSWLDGTPSISGWTYGNQPNLPAAEAKYGTAVITYYTYSGTGYVAMEAPTYLTNAGTYYIKAVVAGDTNYEALESDYINFKIEKADYSAAALEGITWTNTTVVYNGSEQKPEAHGLPVGLDGIALGYTVESKIDAGEYTLTVTFSTTSPNYNVPASTTVSFEITEYTVEITWAQDNFTYNGTDQSGEVTATYTDVNGTPVDLAVTVDGGEFKNVNEGGYTFTAAFAGSDAGSKNYALPADPSAVFHMAPAAVEVTLENQSATYTGSDLSGTLDDTKYTVSGTVYNGDDLGITLSILGGAAIDARTYTIEGASSNANYTVTFHTGVFTITPLGIEVEITAGGGEYGGEIEAATATITGEVPAGVEAEITYTGIANDGTPYVNSITVPTKAGTYTVRVTINNTNYTVSGIDVATMIISRKIVELPEIASKEYTGEALTADIAASELYTVSQGSDWVNVGDYNVEFTLNDASNYRWATSTAATATGIFSITRASNSVTAPSVNETYVYGDVIAPWGAKADFGTVYYVYATEEDSNSYTTTVPTEVGTYYVRAAVAGTTNYFGATSDAAVMFEIVQAEVALPTLDKASTVYSGERQTNLLKGYDSASMKLDLGSLAATQTESGLELYAINVGEYTIKVTLNDTHNFKWAEGVTEVSLTWEITQFTANTVEVSITQPATYGDELKVDVTADMGAESAQIAYYTDNNGSIGELLTEQPTEAGTYWVVATIADTDNYVGGEAEAKFTIQPKTVTDPVSGGTDVTYDGAAHTAYIEGVDLSLMSVSSESVLTYANGKYELTMTDAGDYTITVTLNDSRNYAWASGSSDPLVFTWTVSKLTTNNIEVSITQNAVYGDELVVDVTADMGAESAQIAYYTDNNGSRGEQLSAQPTEAGTYWVVATIADTDNYVGGEASQQFTIQPKTVTDPVSGGASVVYDGAAHTAYIEGVDLSLMSVTSDSVLTYVNGRYELTMTDAGDYTITVTLNDSRNYAWASGSSDPLVFTWTVAQAVNSWTAELEMSGWIYGESPAQPSATAQFGEAVFTYYNAEGDEITPDKLTEAGSYYVVATVEGNENYTGLTARKDFVVEKADYDTTGITWSNTSVVYNGNEQSPVADGLPVGLDGIALEYKVESAVNAGEYTLTVTFSTESTNYNVPASITVEFEITKLAVEIEWTEDNFTYDGTDQQDKVKATFEGVDGVHELVVTLISADEFKEANAEGYIFRAELSAEDAVNYRLPEEVTAVFHIATYEVDVTINPGGGVYGGTITPATVTITGAPEELGYTITYSGTANDGTVYDGEAVPTQAGSYTVTVTLSDGNYTIAGGNTAIMIISRATVTEPDAGSKVYTGAPLIADIPASPLYTVSQEAQINAGSYAVMLTLTDPDNYRWSSTTGSTVVIYFTILRAPNSVTPPTVEEQYIYGEEVRPYGSVARHGTVYYVFSTTEDFAHYTTTAPVDVGVYYVRAMVNATENYQGCVSEWVVFEIVPAVIELPALDFTSSVYDGTQQYNGVNGVDLGIMNISARGDLITLGSVQLTARNAGVYSVTITLKNGVNFTFADGSTTVTLTWTLQRLAVAKPTEDLTEFMENGKVLTYMPEGFSYKLMTIGGNTAIWAGDYVVTVGLADTQNYVWTDGTTDAIHFDFHVDINLMWLIILLSILLILALIALVVLAILLAKERRNNSGGDDNGGTSGTGGPAMYGAAMLAVMPTMALTSQIWICVGLGVACLVVIVIDIVLGVKLAKEKKKTYRADAEGSDSGTADGAGR